MKGSLEHRMEVAKYSLELSYNLISHYDNKTNQQLTIAGFDFAIISMLVTAMFTTTTQCGEATKIVIIVLSAISYVVLAKALWEVRKALMPHVIHHNLKKEKAGILYFKDIKNNFGEEEYVATLIGKKESNHIASKFYSDKDSDSFENCFIEDCARDIFAHAVILEEKTFHVHKAFNWVFATTIACIITVAVSSVLWMLGV